MAVKKIDPLELKFKYSELKVQAKAEGYLPYLSMHFFYDKLANLFKCQPDTIRRFMAKKKIR